MIEFKDLLKRFDHVGLAVRDVDATLKIYHDILGGKLLLYKEIGTTDDYTFTQISLGSQTIEMIEPIKGTKSFLTKFLEEHGEGMHHLTFQVRDIKQAIAYLKGKGIRVVDEFLEVNPLWQTAFISPRSSSGVLIQLYETAPGSEYDHARERV
jgi:methylmalonyl-CoA/ethylmalonyl-CoA epimerase